MTSIKVQKAARIIQQELGHLFLQLPAHVCSNKLVSVTQVQLSSDLGTAHVYLSFVETGTTPTHLVAQIAQHTSLIRRRLGERIREKVRKVPRLRFYQDCSAQQAVHIHRLFQQLESPRQEDKNDKSNKKG